MWKWALPLPSKLWALRGDDRYTSNLFCYTSGTNCNIFITSNITSQIYPKKNELLQGRYPSERNKLLSKESISMFSLLQVYNCSLKYHIYTSSKTFFRMHIIIAFPNFYLLRISRHQCSPQQLIMALCATVAMPQLLLNDGCKVWGVSDHGSG